MGVVGSTGPPFWVVGHVGTLLHVVSNHTVISRRGTVNGGPEGDAVQFSGAGEAELKRLQVIENGDEAEGFKGWGEVALVEAERIGAERASGGGIAIGVEVATHGDQLAFAIVAGEDKFTGGYSVFVVTHGCIQCFIEILGK